MEIGIWGDSITFGAGDSDGLGWVGRLRNQLFLSDDVSVYNRGVCGDTSQDILKRFKVEAESIEPDKIIFAFGTNDSKYPEGKELNNVEFSLFESNVRELIQQAQGFTKDISFISLIKADEDNKTERGSKFVNEDIKKYSDCVKVICLENKLAFIDIFEVVDPQTDLYDIVHPNKEGYEKMYKAISASLNLQN